MPRRATARRRRGARSPCSSGDVAIGVGGDGRSTAVRLFPYLGCQRQRPQQFDAIFFRDARTPAGTEQVVSLAAAVANEIAHVLHDPEDRYVDLGEHLDALSGVRKRDILGSGDDDGTANGNGLGQGELDIAGPGRHIDDKVVQITHADCSRSCLRAPETIGPRHTIGVLLVTIMLMDIASIPCALIGTNCSSRTSGRCPSAIPSMMPWLGP